jgi:hypothetical protein
MQSRGGIAPDGDYLAAVFAARQRSEQNLTLSQSRSHFLRQLNGRSQARQIFVGRFNFLWATA